MIMGQGSMIRQLDRATRVAANDASSSGRQKTLLDAQKNLQKAISNNNNAPHVNNFAGGVAGNSLQNLSNPTVVPILQAQTGAPFFTPVSVAQDNTRVQIINKY